jgi:glycosyltransferase involved in cell wall biosynthesis
MSQPLVSLLIVTYNHAPFSWQALEAALKQDYPNLQIVVTDDASDDGTADIVREFARAHPDRIDAYIDLPHAGILGNCNRGLSACRGEYIAFQDGDDTIRPGKISRQVAWFQESDERVLCGHRADVIEVGADGTSRAAGSIPKQLRTGKGAAHVIRHGPPYAASSVMVRARDIPPGGYDHRLRLALDWKLWIDTLAAGGTWGYVDGTYACYRKHPGSITVRSQHEIAVRQTHLLDNLTTLSLVEASYPAYLRDAQYMRGSILYQHARWCQDRGHHAHARAYLVAALRTRRWARPQIYGALLNLGIDQVRSRR